MNTACQLHNSWSTFFNPSSCHVQYRQCTFSGMFSHLDWNVSRLTSYRSRAVLFFSFPSHVVCVGVVKKSHVDYDANLNFEGVRLVSHDLCRRNGEAGDLWRTITWHTKLELRIETDGRRGLFYTRTSLTKCAEMPITCDLVNSIPLYCRPSVVQV